MQNPKTITTQSHTICTKRLCAQYDELKSVLLTDINAPEVLLVLNG